MSLNISRVSSSHPPPKSKSEMTAIANATIAGAATSSPEITALAACHIEASPSVFSLALKIGMNAAVSAPSPSRRRNRLGTMNA